MTAPASRFKGTCFAFRMEVALAWRSWLLFLPNMSCMRRLWGKNSKTPKASALWGPTSPRKRRTRTWKASMTSLTLWHSKRSRKLCKCSVSMLHACVYVGCIMFSEAIFLDLTCSMEQTKDDKWKNPVLGFPSFRYVSETCPFTAPGTWNHFVVIARTFLILSPICHVEAILTVLSTFTGKPGCHQTLRCLRLSMASDTHLRRCFAKPK